VRVKILRAEVVERAGRPGAVVDPLMVVACGDKAIRVVAAQRPGKTPMSGAELMRGAKLDVGARFNPSAPPQSER
jgi:methionyl-tRNA formyltransferase